MQTALWWAKTGESRIAPRQAGASIHWAILRDIGLFIHLGLFLLYWGTVNISELVYDLFCAIFVFLLFFWCLMHFLSLLGHFGPLHLCHTFVFWLILSFLFLYHALPYNVLGHFIILWAITSMSYRILSYFSHIWAFLISCIFICIGPFFHTLSYLSHNSYFVVVFSFFNFIFYLVHILPELGRFYPTLDHYAHLIILFHFICLLNYS